jgi:biotin transport system permease protein
MRGNAFLVGTYIHGSSPVHRAPLVLKALLVAGCGMAAFMVADWRISAAVVAAVVVLHAVAGLPARHLLRAVLGLWPLILVLGGFQWWQLGLPTAARIVLNILGCVLAAGLLTATTPMQRLLDGLVALATPFRRFGADPERFGLTIAVMLRSIPFVLGAFRDTRDAAKARGLERSPRALVLPVLIGTVAYARQTGEALAARGLAEPDAPSDI